MTRKGAIDELMSNFKDQGFVHLMATNIAYVGDGETVKWAVNLDNIKNSLD